MRCSRWSCPPVSKGANFCWSHSRSPSPTLTGSTSTEPIDLASLSGRQWVSSQQGTSCHQMVQQTCGSAYLAPNTIAYCSDLATQLTMAANHIGIRGRSPIDREGGSGRTGCLVG
ncbi:LysR substrate-binding domain-containing protein [Streptomyces mirabilis]|uniref:LysR substrate-binding domain-containing protein n=1 Tax=Streptomyces mirabilis TaxID=68239 RepID=UPI0033BDAE18